MKKLISLFLAVFLIILFDNSLAASKSNILTQQLQEYMQTAKNDELIRINITMKNNFDSQNLIKRAQTLRGEARRQYVISILKDFSERSQKGLIAELNQLKSTKTVEKVTSYWIANVINCYANTEAIIQLACRNDIESIDYDEYHQLLDPGERKNSTFENGFNGSKEITWNVIKINADEVWALGYNGEGVIVAVIDTGVNYEHLDLEDHVWENDEYPNHGYDFANDDNDPKDDNGHGTHCAGTVAGDGSAGCQTGVAPGATIMCLKALDSYGGGNESSVWSAVEFAVEHGANIISLSLGWMHALAPNRVVWRQTFDNSLAAGIVASVAAGNYGDDLQSFPIPDNVLTPGDCPPPWLNTDQSLEGGVSGVISVGATTSNDEVSYFSALGPVDWSDVNTYNDYPYNPDMGLIRPDLVAPGSDIKSLTYFSNSAYASGWSGTSMATPAYAGMIALMLQKNNMLTPEEISQISEETTLVLQEGKNNASGSGRIDCLAAIQAVPFPGPGYYAHYFNDETGNNNNALDPGETILLTLSMANFSDETAADVTVKLTTENEYITITDNEEAFGDFGEGDIIEIENAFSFDVADDVPDELNIKFIISAQSNDKTWISNFSVTARGVSLQTGNLWINDASGNNNGILDPAETADLHINILNKGRADAHQTFASLTSGNQYINIDQSSCSLETIQAGESKEAVFHIDVNENATSNSYAELKLQIESGGYSLNKEYNPKVGLIVDDFETGDFSKFNWGFNGDKSWTIEDSAKFEGTFAAVSGNIDNNEESELVLITEVAINDTIAFHMKTSSEENYDFLRFYIDNDLLGEWSGNKDWIRLAFPVNEGEHSFRWIYTKDYGTSTGNDCAWIDFIEMPAANESVTVSAGSGSVDFLIYPNPVHDNLFIGFNGSQNAPALISVYSSLGCLIDKIYFSEAFTLNVSNYLPGIYFVELSVGDKNAMRKIIIR